MLKFETIFLNKKYYDTCAFLMLFDFEQIEIQERRNRPLPPGWAVDSDGKVSFIMLIINIEISI